MKVTFDNRLPAEDLLTFHVEWEPEAGKTCETTFTLKEQKHTVLLKVDAGHDVMTITLTPETFIFTVHPNADHPYPPIGSKYP